jgi:hypothetical protein
VAKPMFFNVVWSAQNSRFTMQIYETSGKCRTYRFSIDDDTLGPLPDEENLMSEA